MVIMRITKILHRVVCFEFVLFYSKFDVRLLSDADEKDQQEMDKLGHEVKTMIIEKSDTTEF